MAYGEVWNRYAASERFDKRFVESERLRHFEEESAGDFSDRYNADFDNRRRDTMDDKQINRRDRYSPPSRGYGTDSDGFRKRTGDENNRRRDSYEQSSSSRVRDGDNDRDRHYERSHRRSRDDSADRRRSSSDRSRSRDRERSKRRDRRSRSRDRDRRNSRRSDDDSFSSRSGLDDKRHRSNTSRRDDKRRDSRDDWDSDRDRRGRDHKRKAPKVPPPLPRSVPWVPPPIPQQPLVQNQFRNDGSFMEMFRQQMSAASTTGQTDISSVSQSTSTAVPGATPALSSTAVAAAVADGANGTSVLPVIAKRRAAKILKTGIVHKPKKEEQVEEKDNSNDAWSRYMQEVNRYRSNICIEEDSKTRPLMK